MGSLPEFEVDEEEFSYMHEGGEICESESADFEDARSDGYAYGQVVQPHTSTHLINVPESGWPFDMHAEPEKCHAYMTCALNWGGIP